MTAALAADADVEMEEADMTRWTEAEFEDKCTYVVKDTAREAGPDGGDAMTTTRAEASLPRNLTFRHPADSEEVRVTHTHTERERHTHTQRERDTHRERETHTQRDTPVSQGPVMSWRRGRVSP